MTAVCVLLFSIVTSGSGQAPPGGRGQAAAPQPPATDTVAPGIAGVVSAGAKVHVIKDGFNGSEGTIALPDGSVIFSETAANRTVKIDKDSLRYRRLLRWLTEGTQPAGGPVPLQEMTGAGVGHADRSDLHLDPAGEGVRCDTVDRCPGQARSDSLDVEQHTPRLLSGHRHGER